MARQNEIDANGQLSAAAARTCPPCNGSCNQGRACPGRITMASEDRDAFGPWVGLRNALGAVVVVVILVGASCELLRRAFA